MCIVVCVCGHPFSAPHFAQQLQNGTLATPAQPPFSIQEVNGAASSGFVSSSLLSRSAISSQVTAGPTSNGTGDVMPLAEAITQLSFLEFLQRCGVSIAPPQPSQPPVPISLQDATVQTTPPCDVSHQVSTQTSDQQDTLSCDVSVQTSSHGTHISSLDVAAQTTSPSTLSQHVSTQMGSRSASSFSVDMFVQTPVRSTVLHDVATQLPLTEFFIGCIYSNSPLDRRDFVRQSPPSMQGSHALLQPPPGLEQPAPPPELAAYSHSCLLHMVRLLTLFPVMPSSRLSVPPLWERTLYAQLPAPKEVLVPPLREPTILLVLILVQDQVPSLYHGHWFFPWSKFGQPKSDRLRHIDTVDSDLMHHQLRLSLLQWNPGPARRNPTNIVSAACGKFHAVILQEASDHVPYISDQFRASTRIPLSLTL